MFELKIFFVDRSVVSQPVFELARGLDDVHAGNNSDRRPVKSNAVVNDLRWKIATGARC